MNRVPYIGITDFTHYSQVLEMLEVFASRPASWQRRRLHVGVMMSYKTLNGIDTSWAKSFPKNEDIAGIFASPYTMNCLHYADYDAVEVEENLTRAVVSGGPGMNALQLDMLWPNPGAILHAVSSVMQPIEVIVQVGKQAIIQSGDSPFEIVKRLRPYVGIAHHVLIDKSMGKGQGMDATTLLPFVRAICSEYPQFGITVAGGLGPTSMDLVKPVVSEFPQVSIDAQGKLRPSGDAHDPIDWDMAAEYLKQALTMFR
jgi:hypothetical protein